MHPGEFPASLAFHHEALFKLPLRLSDGFRYTADFLPFFHVLDDPADRVELLPAILALQTVDLMDFDVKVGTLVPKYPNLTAFAGVRDVDNLSGRQSNVHRHSNTAGIMRSQSFNVETSAAFKDPSASVI
jgi:hypothetical protein